MVMIIKQKMNGNPVLKVEKLCKNFGDLRAVENLSFEVQRNEIFGLLGPNGAGKSTTINMICGLLKPSSGKIHFAEGLNRSAIGYCPQENIFYPKLTCLEQLVFIGEMYGLSNQSVKRRADELLEALGLNSKRKNLAANLSGGMKRRLNIALALVHDPEIVILDEPEAGLDPQSRVLVRDFIKAMGKEKTVILTTHNMDEADRLSDRVAIMDHGKLLLLDTPEKLKKQIGEGDLLELNFEDGANLKGFVNRMETMQIEISVHEKGAFIRDPNLLVKIADIRNAAMSCGLNILEMKLRENTLEDVFIHLTGRGLRV
jgi:ABC-2 type transport system ATP-binding protein